MKKLAFLVITLLMGIFLVACSSGKNERAESLQVAYFNMVEKLENNEEIEEDYAKALLDQYEYEKGDEINIGIGDEESQVHMFNNDEEKLTIVDTKVSNKIYLELLYQNSSDKGEIWLSYGSLEGSAAMNVAVYEDELYKEVYSVVDVKDSKLLENYNYISQKILNEEDISVDEVKSLVNIELTMEDTVDLQTSSEITYYSFTDGQEVLGVYTIKGQGSISRVSYGNNEKLLIKNTIGKELIEGSNKAMANISDDLVDIEMQLKVSNMFSK